MDGIAVYVAPSGSSLSGWTVGLGVPVAIVEAPGRTSRWAIIGGGCVFLLLAGGLASVFGGGPPRGERPPPGPPPPPRARRPPPPPPTIQGPRIRRLQRG